MTGINRLQFVVVTAIVVGLQFIRVGFAGPDGPTPLSIARVLVVSSSLVLWVLVAVPLRLVNTGMSLLWLLGLWVPFVNIFILLRLFFMPPKQRDIDPDLSPVIRLEDPPQSLSP